MAKNFYAVKVGKTPGIYTTWAECQNQIHGFPGAVFKGFSTREEAQAFLDGRKTANPLEAQDIPPEKTQGINPKKTQAANFEENQPPNPEEGKAIAYVDGSYDSVTHSFSYGMVLFTAEGELHFSEKLTDSALAEMHNVAGEIKGAEAALRYCLENKITAVTIYHDYEGIAKWCTGQWQARKEGTIAYAAFCKEAGKKVKIEFVKVKGHSGDKYNDLADKLAKAALGLEEKETGNDKRRIEQR